MIPVVRLRAMAGPVPRASPAIGHELHHVPEHDRLATVEGGALDTLNAIRKALKAVPQCAQTTGCVLASAAA
jgi:hypothetical protein